MMRWFVYIVMFLVIAPFLSSANLLNSAGGRVPSANTDYYIAYTLPLADTIIKKRPPDEDDKNKIKEISKAKRQSKPEKIDGGGNTQPKPNRERRPEGMERPPEIPRRNGN